MLRLKALEVAVVEVAKDHSYWCALTAGELENTLHLEIREHRAIKRKKNYNAGRKYFRPEERKSFLLSYHIPSHASTKM